MLTQTKAQNAAAIAHWTRMVNLAANTLEEAGHDMDAAQRRHWEQRLALAEAALKANRKGA